MRRALIIDDDAAIRSLVSIILRRAGYVTSAAPDGAEAISALAGSTFHVVVLDLMMPRLSGYDVLAWMAEHRQDHLARTIVLTAFAKATAENVPGACTVLQKPFDIPDLLAIIGRCSASDEEAPPL